jgi:hypothetical protein
MVGKQFYKASRKGCKMTDLVDAFGREYKKIPVVKINGLVLPALEMDREALRRLDPNEVNMIGLLSAFLDQTSSQNNLLWLGLFNLAKDIYARDPVLADMRVRKERFFQSFAEEVGLILTDVQGTKLNIAEELNKI